MSPGIPIIKLTVEHMQQAILHAFNTYQLEQDEYLKEELERVLSPDNIKRMMREQVGPVIENAIKNALLDHFNYGEGKKLLDRGITEVLNNVPYIFARPIQ